MDLSDAGGAAKFALDLEIKSSGLGLKKRVIQATAEYIECNGDKMYLIDVEAIRYGVTQNYTNGVHTGNNFDIFLRNKGGSVMKIQFFMAPKRVEEGNQYFNQLVDFLWVNVTSRLINDYWARLNSGEEIDFDAVKVTPQGLRLFVPKLFKKKEFFVPWNDAAQGITNGQLHVHSISNKKKCQLLLPLKDRWNVVVLRALLDWLWQEGRVFALADRFGKGTTNG